MTHATGHRALSIAAPQLDEREVEAVTAVLRSGGLAQGPRVAELEERFADYCGASHCVAVSNGTTALHAALLALGVGPGDDVLTVPFTFVATANAVLMSGATPVFVDVRADDFGMDVSQAEALVTERTKAILPVHLYGQPYDVAGVRALAEKHSLAVLEDAAQAVGAADDAGRVGSLGDAASFSLYATKNLMCGEGGLITTGSADVAQRLRSLRQHGMSGPYEYLGLGYNYRMSDLHAAVALVQLDKLDGLTAVRQVNAAAYDEGLSGLEGLRTPFRRPGATHVFHQYTLVVEPDAPVSRDALVDALRQRGVGAGVYYPKALDEYAHLSGFGRSVVARQLASSVLSLPVHPGLTLDDVAWVVSVIRQAWER